MVKALILAEKYAVNAEWYIEMMHDMIRWASEYMTDNVWYRVIQVR